MKKYNNLFILIGTAIIFSSLTYYLAPAKIKIKEVEKIVEIKGDTKVVYKEKIKIIIRKPDGTIIEKDLEKEFTKEEHLTKKTKDTIKEKVTIRQKLKWSITGGILIDSLNNPEKEYYLAINRKIVGMLHIGMVATSNNSIGLGIGFSF